MFSFLASTLLSVSLLTAPPKPLHWEASYGKALEATRADNTPLLVVLDKPNSKAARVEPQLLGMGESDDKSVELLRPYRLCHVDVTTDYGQKVARAFRATSFPHVAIIDKSGSKVIFRKTGHIQAEEWQQILVQHRRGVGPVRRAISRITNRPVDAMLNGGPAATPYCPSCQRNSF
jgi:hypothetical protein